MLYLEEMEGGYFLIRFETENVKWERVLQEAKPDKELKLTPKENGLSFRCKVND